MMGTSGFARDDLLRIVQDARRNAKHRPQWSWLCIARDPGWTVWYVKLTDGHGMTVDGCGRRWRWSFDGPGPEYEHIWSDRPHHYADSWAAKRGAERWLKRNRSNLQDA